MAEVTAGMMGSGGGASAGGQPAADEAFGGAPAVGPGSGPAGVGAALLDGRQPWRLQDLQATALVDALAATIRGRGTPGRPSAGAAANKVQQQQQQSGDVQLQQRDDVGCSRLGHTVGDIKAAASDADTVGPQQDGDQLCGVPGEGAQGAQLGWQMTTLRGSSSTLPYDC
eukprot:gene7976-8174_t